jgi:cephalosporin hydroxylase
VDLVFIDSSHEYDDTLAEFRAWQPAVRAGGHIAFHDYGTREGVTTAVDELRLDGAVKGTSLYVWRKP